MKISLAWLNTYLDRPVEADQVERVLTDQGLPIESRSKAGCDVVLHCTGVLAEMREILSGIATTTPDAAARWGAARALLRPPEPADRAALAARVDVLLAG